MLALTTRAFPDGNISAKEERLIARAVAVLQRRMVGGEPLTTPEAAGEFLRLRLAPLDREVFFLLLLDTRHRVVAAEMVFMGTIEGAEVHPRVVARHNGTPALRATVLATVLYLGSTGDIDKEAGRDRCRTCARRIPESDQGSAGADGAQGDPTDAWRRTTPGAST